MSNRVILLKETNHITGNSKLDKGLYMCLWRRFASVDASGVD